MPILFRILGGLVIASSAVIVLAVGAVPIDHGLFAPVAYSGLVFIAIGLLSMIGHLNLSDMPSSDEKGRWRRHLWWGGPFVAGWYLLAVAGNPQPVPRKTNRLRSAETNAVVGAAIIFTLAMISTLVERLRPHLSFDSALDKVIYFASQSMASLVGTIVALSFRVPLHLAILVLVPSWLFVLWQHRGSALQFSVFVVLFLAVGLALKYRLR